MKFALKAGLRLISGKPPQRQHELVRLLPDGEVQLEDVLTRRPRVMKESELVRQVFSGSLVPMTLSQEMRGSKEVREVTYQGLPTVDLSAIRPDWLEQINYRLRYVKGMQKAHLNGCGRTRLARMIRTVASEVNDPSPPSTSSVLAWDRRLRQNEMNPLALLSGNKSRAVTRRFPEAVETLIAQTLKKEYFTKSCHTLGHAHSRLKGALQIAVRDGTVAAEDANVSLATLSRRVKDTDFYYRVSSREGEGRARMLTRTTMDGTVASYPLQKVEVDHTPLDWVVICDDTGLPLGRPWLTVVIDAYSGYVLGLYLTFYAPGVSSVVGALRNSIEPKDELIKRLGLSTPWLSHGLADEWVLDNGMEFHSRAFQQIMWTLGTDVSYCRVRTPWLKPHVERFFGELNSLTLARGRVHKAMANAVRMDPYKDAAVGFGDLVKGLTMFVTEGHALKINQRKLSRPIDLFREGLERCPPAVYPGSLENLRIVSGMSKHLAVGPGGLELHGIPYGRAELLPWRKELGERFKAFVKWDPDDMGALHVQHPLRATEWLRCPTRWPDYAEGLSFNQHRLIRKFARERLKESGALEELQAARMSLHDHWRNACRPTTRTSCVTAARAAGITSAGTFNPPVKKGGKAPPPLAEPRIILDDRIEPRFDDDIPDFGGFELGSN